MKHRKQILVLSVLAALALVSFFPAGSAWGQVPQPEPGPILVPVPAPCEPILSMGVFVGANTPGNADASMILTNTGESGDLCADIYVFNPVGQMIACCACPVKRNGALELSVNNNLTKNPVTGVVPTKGVIMALPSSDCYPSHPNLAAGMKTYTITRSNTSSIVPTHEACVSDQLLTLMRQCANIQRNGGGLGICSCPAQ